MTKVFIAEYEYDTHESPWTIGYFADLKSAHDAIHDFIVAQLIRHDIFEPLPEINLEWEIGEYYDWGRMHRSFLPDALTSDLGNYFMMQDQITVQEIELGTRMFKTRSEQEREALREEYLAKGRAPEPKETAMSLALKNARVG